MNGTVRSGVTVGELTENEVDAVDAFCAKCGNLWWAPITFLPPATTLATVEALMVCPICGSHWVEIHPAMGIRISRVQ